MKDYYEILGVKEDATAQEIKTAYRQLSRQYHPDLNKEPDAEKRMQEINEAYQTLSDTGKRQAYDMGDVNQNINDIFQNMGFNINIDFGNVVNNPFVHTAQSDKTRMRHAVNISFKDAIFGCEVDAVVPSYIICADCSGVGGNKATCHKCKGAGQNITMLGTMQFPALCIVCNGKGYVLTSACRNCNQEGVKKKTRHIKVKIPAGTQHHTMLRIESAADDKCEVFIVVNVMPHPKISRNGATLFSTEVVSCLDAMIGGSKMVDTIDGMCELIIPAGTQHGQQLVIEGRGGILSNGRANHLVNVHIEIPKDLTPKQVAKLKEIKEDKDGESANGRRKKEKN